MEALGIDQFLLLGQLVNFAILFFILKRFLYKPVLGMIDKRKHEIEEGLRTAHEMEEKEERLKEKQDKLLSEAKKDAKAFMEETKKQLEQQKKQILADAHKQAQEIVAKARTAAEEVHKSQQESLRREAVELASAMVTKLVPTVLSDDDHRKLIATHLKDLSKTVKH